MLYYLHVVNCQTNDIMLVSIKEKRNPNKLGIILGIQASESTLANVRALGVNECIMCSICCHSVISTLKIMDAIKNNEAAWEFSENAT